jgi:hypothetical protein
MTSSTSVWRWGGGVAGGGTGFWGTAKAPATAVATSNEPKPATVIRAIRSTSHYININTV